MASERKKLDETKKKVTEGPIEGSDFASLIARTGTFVTDFVHHIQDAQGKDIKSQDILKALKSDAKELLKSLAIATTIFKTNDEKSPIHESLLIETKDDSLQIALGHQNLIVKKSDMSNHYKLSINHKEINIVSQLSLTEIAFLIQNPIDAIAICGNNDLRQVDHMASVYQLLTQIKAKLFSDFIIPDKIFISGKGGHGTSPGPIFGHTEAETMKRRLLECGISESSIVIEIKATNSGQNVQFLGPIMLQEQEKAKHPYHHILVSGTPVGILRQVRTFEQQSNPKLQWERYSTLPPPVENILQQYYVNNTSAAINMTAALREFGQFLNYTVNNNFMTSREFPDKQILKNSIRVFTDYYNQLTGIKTPIDSEKLATAFIKYSHKKAQNITDEKLKKNLQTVIGPMLKFFGTSFNLIELQWMKLLSSTQSLAEQAFHIPASKRIMDIFGVDPAKNRDSNIDTKQKIKNPKPRAT